MRRRTVAGVMLLCILPFVSFAQGRKTVEKKGIVEQTVYEYFVAEGLSKPVVEEIINYDEQGNVLEHQVFNKYGEYKSWERFRYDEDGNKVEEIILDGSGKQVERFEWIYEDDLVVEKKYYDDRDRLVKRKEYKFSYRDQ
jgi:YD repeat-containing protein